MNSDMCIYFNEIFMSENWGVTGAGVVLIGGGRWQGLGRGAVMLVEAGLGSVSKKLGDGYDTLFLFDRWVGGGSFACEVSSVVCSL